MTRLRWLTQMLGFFLGNGYFSFFRTGHIYKGPFKGVCVPFLNCYACPMAVFSCPIGSLQHFMTIRAIPLLLIGTLGMIGILVGRMGCGWLCPFGLLQDLLYKIPSRKYGIFQPLLHLKYASLLFLAILIPFATGVPWFSKLCPYGTLTAGIPWVILNPRDPVTQKVAISASSIGFLFALKLVILGVFLALFVMIKRPFCRTFCPLGAIFSLFNRVSIVQLKVTGQCRQCGKCRANCPVDIQISENPVSRECIRCLNCTSCKNVSVEIGPLRTKAKPVFSNGRETT